MMITSEGHFVDNGKRHQIVLKNIVIALYITIYNTTITYSPVFIICTVLSRDLFIATQFEDTDYKYTIGILFK